MIQQRTILATIFSVIILSTSMGAVLYKHICGDLVQEVAFSEIENACKHGDHEDSMPCHQHDKEEDDCCKNEKQKISTDDTNVNKDENHILKSGSSFVTVFYVLINYLFSNPLDSQAQVVSIIDTSPPLPANPYQILFQQFLI